MAVEMALAAWAASLCSTLSPHHQDHESPVDSVFTGDDGGGDRRGLKNVSELAECYWWLACLLGPGSRAAIAATAAFLFDKIAPLGFEPVASAAVYSTGFES